VVCGNYKERVHLGDIDINGRIMLICVLEQCNELIWLRIGFTREHDNNLFPQNVGMRLTR